MKSSFDILSALYQIIEPEVEISGKVIIGEETMGDQNENVCLNLLNNPIEYTQQGILNVNVFVMGDNDQRPNMYRMRELVNCIFPLLDNQVHYLEKDEITLHLKIEDDKGVFKSFENKGKFFYNIRVQFLTL